MKRKLKTLIGVNLWISFLFSTTENSHTDAATVCLIICMWSFEIQIAADHNNMQQHPDRWKDQVRKGIEANTKSFKKPL